MLRLLGATLSLFSGYHALLVLIPLYLAAAGASPVIMGSATAVFMVAGVIGHIAGPLTVRGSTRAPFIATLLATSAAAIAHLLTIATVPTLVLTAARGIAYGVGAVVSATAVAHLAPAPRRVQALAAYGGTAALPGIVASSAVVFIAEQAGFPAAFLLVAAITFAAVFLLLPTPAPPDPGDAEALTRLGPLPATTLPLAVLFTGAAMGYGAVLTFVPPHLTAQSVPASPFVLATALGLAAFRWGGGVAVVRWGAARVLGSGLALGSIGMALLALLPAAHAFLAGFTFGAGFGFAATATHSILTTRTQRTSLGKANAVFNVAWSGGMGIGAFVFGVVATLIGQTQTYATAAAWQLLLIGALALLVLKAADWEGVRGTKSGSAS